MREGPIAQDATQQDAASLAATVQDLARFADDRGTAPLGAFLRDLADRLSGRPANPST